MIFLFGPRIGCSTPSWSVIKKILLHLVYLHENRCRWNEKSCEKSSEKGHLELNLFQNQETENKEMLNDAFPSFFEDS